VIDYYDRRYNRLFAFRAETPIYLQVMDEIKGHIAAGRLAPGAKIDSIRELAAFYAVNPNTVQRALLELERDGLLSTQRASGKLVTEDTRLIEELRANLAEKHAKAYFSALGSLGFGSGEIHTFTEEMYGRLGIGMPECK
jgi:DNA-binding transcriptional regulator YhcF (GntR family)